MHDQSHEDEEQRLAALGLTRESASLDDSGDWVLLTSEEYAQLMRLVRHTLRRRMSEVAQQMYGQPWTDDLPVVLWAAIMDDTAQSPLSISVENAVELRELAEVSRGWWERTLSGRMAFLPLDTWVVRYHANAARSGRESTATSAKTDDQS